MAVSEIALRGLASGGNDYECKDGELAVCHNCVNDGAGLAGVEKVSVFSEIEGYRLVSGYEFKGLVFVHNTSAGARYIGVGSDRCLYVYSGETMFPGSSHDYVPTFYYWEKIPFCAEGLFAEGKYAVSSVGNVLVVVINNGGEHNGLHYLRYNNTLNAYQYLGQRPPDACLEFSLSPYQENVLDLNAESSENDDSMREWSFYRIGSQVVVDNVGYVRSFSKTYNGVDNLVGNVQDALFGTVNRIERKLREHEIYAHPFFVRYAYRLYDGSYIMQSTPVLMLADTYDKQDIMFYVRGDTYIIQSTFVKSTLNLAVNITESEKESLKRWESLIDKVCVFITPSIWSYMPEGVIRVTPYTKEESKNIYHYRSCMMDSVVTHAYTLYDMTGGFLELHGINKVYDVELPIRDGSLTERLEQAYNFYLLKEYSLDEILSMAETNRIVSGRQRGIIDIEANERLPEGYNVTKAYVPSIMHTYNSRISMGNVSLKENPVIKRSAVGQYVNSDAIVRMTVYIEEEGVINISDTGEIQGHYMHSGFFFYPNPNAKYMKWEIRHEDFIATEYVKMKRHPFLNGAYYFGGRYIEIIGLLHTPDIVGRYSGSNTDTNQGNYMYTSLADNPFVFPATGVNSIGNGTVVALATATKAMSEGTEFGTMPLYAFCTDGIWALSVGETGVFAAKQPVSRDTLLGNDPAVVTEIDNSVLFLSERGLMELTGGQTRLLSGAVSEADGLHVLPYWDYMIGGADYISAGMFNDYIRGARIAFDYVNYRVYVFRPYSSDATSSHTAFVYDISSGMWGTVENRMLSAVSVAPDTLVNVSDGDSAKVARFVKGSGAFIGSGKAFFVTRPLKMGAADVMKTVRMLIERGKAGFDTLALWGSRDLPHWGVVGAVKGNKMPRISGTPYKYFIVAGFFTLGKGDAVSRLTMEFVPKYRNKLR